MNTLVIESSHITPNVQFDPSSGILELSGTSLPEDSFQFYKPLIDWLSTYAQQPAPQTELSFRMEYFNTSSTAYILKLIKEIAQIRQKGHSVTVKWYHDSEDGDMYEAGKGLGMLANIPVELIAFQA